MEDIIVCGDPGRPDLLAEPGSQGKAASTPNRVLYLLEVTSGVRRTFRPETMPFSVTRRERMILAVIALLVVLGLLGMAIL